MLRVLIVTMFLMGSVSAYAFEKFDNLLSYDEFKKLKDNDDVVVVDSLSPIEHDAGTIPGSVNVPMEEVLEDEVLPFTPDKKVVFFCKGVKCHKSHVSAFKAKELGYENVYVYPGGTPEWKDKGNALTKDFDYSKIEVKAIEAFDLKARIDAGKKQTIIDIQDAQSFKSQNIDGAVNIPFYELKDRYFEIPRKTKVIVVDKAGKQSKMAAQFLKNNGYMNITYLKGGTEAWNQMSQ